VSFLFSGPQVPPHGGFLVARAESADALTAYLADEPFVKAKGMRFTRVIEFDAAQYQGFLGEWFRTAERTAHPVAERA